jgi:cupin fold WbuC family metalloprotein
MPSFTPVQSELRSGIMKPDRIQSVDKRRLAELAREASVAPRRRAHLLLHDGPQDQVQRLMIMLQPGSYVRPHHHSQQWEMLVLQQGCGDVLMFDELGILRDRIELSERAPVAQIPVGLWHGFVVREPDTAVMEIKPGPYRPNEFATWAPQEGDPKGTRYVAWAAGANVGTTWPG